MITAISLKKDKKYKTIYCYGDGYPLAIGSMLIINFNDIDKVETLVSKGDIPYLVTELDNVQSLNPFVELDSAPKESYNYVFKDNKWYFAKWDPIENKHEDWRVLRNII